MTTIELAMAKGAEQARVLKAISDQKPTMRGITAHQAWQAHNAANKANAISLARVHISLRYLFDDGKVREVWADHQLHYLDHRNQDLGEALRRYS